MSAASSGFQIPYSVRTITETEKKNLSVGTTLIQRKRIMNLPQDRFSEWIIKSISDNGTIVLQPVKGLRGESVANGCIFNENLTRSLSNIFEEFYIKPSQGIRC